jgi:hypothetical protein
MSRTRHYGADRDPARQPPGIQRRYRRHRTDRPVGRPYKNNPTTILVLMNPDVDQPEVMNQSDFNVLSSFCFRIQIIWSFFVILSRAVW